MTLPSGDAHALPTNHPWRLRELTLSGPLLRSFKQTGEAADAADNVFHPLTYEGAVDLDAETDPRRRRAMEAQINEFGQCPRQLFRKPHPPRLAAPAGEPDPDCDSDSEMDRPSDVSI